MLSPECMQALTKSGNINDTQLESLNKAVCENLLASMQGKSSVSCDTEHKDIYVALGVLILEAAKADLPNDELTKILIACKWPASRISSFLTVYKARKRDLISLMSTFNSAFPRIVGLDWRLDLKILDSDDVGELLYFVKLSTEAFNPEEKLKFSATTLELEDLVNSLKEACQSLKLGASFTA